jgi:thymidylate synthase ThyX
MFARYHVESFAPAQRSVLERHVTSLEAPAFALMDLPPVTAAALFARYSRSPKSLRRLLIDEFAGDLGAGAEGARAGSARLGEARASDLFGRVLAEYGDDSVAQLAGVHLACEQVSQPLAKAIEWGRLASYLEQSTRYIAYSDRRDGRYRYHLDPQLMASELGSVYSEAMDGLFDAYAACLEPVRAHLDRTLPVQPDARARARALRALSLDICRSLLPAGTVSNVGVFGSPQAMEQLVMRLRAHPLPEANSYAELVAGALQQVIPDFLTRLDRPDRGGAWVDYLRETAAATDAAAAELLATGSPSPATGLEGDSVRLLRWESDAEERILAAALAPHTALPHDELEAAVRRLPGEGREALFAAVVGVRGNRRHRPGRGFEHAEYTFEIVSDYGAFRDLQRHRLLTIHWQRLTPALGAAVPEEVEAAGEGERWRRAVARAEAAYGRLLGRFPEQAKYCVTLGHRLRYTIRLNAREAMHLIELRSSPQGHPSYRRTVQEMHRQIGEVAGHRLVAAAMRFVGADDVHLPRYAAEAARSGGTG